MARLVLASASPRRRALLEQLGFTFEVIAADIDESVHRGESASGYVERLAQLKARAVLALQRDVVVLAADTSVVVDDVILGKPGVGAQEGRVMLERLSGRAHEVVTGLTVATEQQVQSRVVRTTVVFKQLTAAEIEWYIGTQEGADKAGGYAFQARAAAFISRIEGSATSVIGLPLVESLELLSSVGIRWP
jgi:septum formation protein